MNNTPTRKFHFTVQVGETTSYESPDLELLPKGIRLHFLRYGLFPRYAKQDVVTGDPFVPVEQQFHKTLKREDGELKRFSITPTPEPEPETSATVSERRQRNRRRSQTPSDQLIEETYPTIELEEVHLSNVPGMPTGIHQLYTGTTCLRAGFLYLINDEDPNDYYEYEVDAAGKLNTITWDYPKNLGPDGQPKDIRKNEADHLQFKVLKPKSKKLWIAYSPVQWSRSFFNEINSNAEKRAQLMTLFDCQGIRRGQETATPQVVPYTHIDTVFTADDPYQHGLQQLLDTIHANELQQQEDPEQDQELLEDMFIILHDPIGCVRDISENLDDAIIHHQAQVEAMRFGEDPAGIVTRLKNRNPRTEISDRAKDQSDLFTLAATLYPLVFNDPRTIQKYANGHYSVGSANRRRARQGLPPTRGGIKPSIIQDKLTKALGVTERKARRTRIRGLQKDLKTYLESCYVDDAITHFLGSDVCAIWGKTFIAPSLQYLAIDPYAIDKSLDLKSHREAEIAQANAEGYSELRDFLRAKITCREPETQLDALLAYDVNSLEDHNLKDAFVNTVNLANKSMGFFSAFLDTLSKVVIDDPEFSPRTMAMLAIGKINTFKIRFDDHTLLSLDLIDDRALAKELNGKLLDLEEGVDTAPHKKTTPKHITRVDLRSPNIVFKTENGTLTQVGVPATDPNAKPKKIPTKNATTADAILNSPAFKRMVWLFEVVNLSVATHKVFTENNLKNRINAIGVLAELSEASLRLREMYLLQKGSQRGLGFLGKLGLNTASIAGAGITSVMCFWDAVDLYSDRDDDAAYAMAGAGVAYTVVTVATVATIAAQSAAAGSAIGATITGIIGGTAWAGPAGWIAAVVGIGCVGLSFLLTDTPMQKYLANCPFNNDTPLLLPPGKTLAQLPAWEHNALFYNQRVALLEERRGSENTVTDFDDALAKLHDILVGSQVEVHHFKLWNLRNGYIKSHTRKRRQRIVGYAEQYTFTIQFNAFLKTVDQLEYQLYYYPKGIKRQGTYECISQTQDHKIKLLKNENKQPYAIRFKVKLPYRDIIKPAVNQQLPCDLLLVYRLQMPNGGYYPISVADTPHHAGVIIPMKYYTISGTQTYVLQKDDEEARIAPLPQLLDYSAWKKKDSESEVSPEASG